MNSEQVDSHVNRSESESGIKFKNKINYLSRDRLFFIIWDSNRHYK